MKSESQKSKHTGRKPKFDYKSEEFLSQVETYAKKGFTDREIAFALGLAPQTFCEKKNEHSELCEVLARGREHRVHVGLPGGLLLPVCAGLPRRPAGHLDGHVSGLGVPLPVLLCTLRARQVAGTAGHLNLSPAFYKSLPRRQALFYAIRTNNLFVFQQCCLLSFLFLSHSRRIISQC